MSANALFEKYLALLLKWNQTYNLTSVVDPREIRIKHFEDSLAPLPFLPKPCRLLDIGTGAGFPGIPLKIARPDLEVVLLDSGRKKIAFCEAVIRELGLQGIQTCQGRAESKPVQDALGFFDMVISRATFSLKDFLELAFNYTKKAGLAIAMKGQHLKEEHLSTSKWELRQTYDYELSKALGKRRLLIFRKILGRDI